MRKVIVIIGLCLLGLPREGHVSSVTYETVSLESAVRTATSIVEAEYRGEVKNEDQYRILKIIKAGHPDLQPGKTIVVQTCGYANIRNSPEGESPLFPAYGKLMLHERKKGDKTLLFLNHRADPYEFAVHPGIVSLKELTAIQKILANPSMGVTQL